MLKPSIDTLLDKVPSKYSLVILEANGPTNWKSGAVPTQEFQSVKSTLQALEEIESGNVVVHPDPEAKREALRRRIEAERIRKRRRAQNEGTNCQRKEDGEKIQVGDFSILFFAI